jgi:hypothetical protein
MRRLVAIAGSVSVLTGCQCPPAPVVKIPEPIAVPRALLAAHECPQLRPGATNGELLVAYHDCKAAVAEHEADKAAIGELGAPR